MTNQSAPKAQPGPKVQPDPKAHKVHEADVSAMKTYKRLLTYTRRHLGVLLMSVLGMICYAATDAAFAWGMKPMIDGSFVTRDPLVMKLVPIGLLVIFLVRGISGFISSYFMSWVGWQVIKRLRAEMFHHLVNLPIHVYDRSSSGELISKLTFNVERVASAATDSITIVIRDSLTILGLMCLMFYYSAELSLILLVVTPIIAWIALAVAKTFRKISKKIQSSMGKVTHVVEETIESNRVVKIFGGQEYEIQRFDEINERDSRLRLRMRATESISVPIIQFFVAMALALVVYLATLENLVNSFTAGTFISFITAMLMLFGPLRRLTTVNSKVQTGIAAGESVFNLLDEKLEPDSGKLIMDKVGAIEIKDLSFSYNEAKGKVVDKVSLNINAGETVALVGRSGSGKTTLVNLLARFYEFDTGSIMIDGHDVREYTLASLRDKMAYVGQEVTLFNDTIAHNIAYGRLGSADKTEIQAAAKAAHAAGFIEAMPLAYDTMVGENGVLLSGGQRQRLSIARALLKNAPLLIMDEAMSALDNESERIVQDALQELLKNRTTIVIAHRLSTIEKADKIIVMDQGRIVEMGDHKSLLAKGQHYKNLYKMQFTETAAT